MYGEWAGLGDAQLDEGRDLAVTSDFRSALARVAERHLQLGDRQLASVFPGLPAKGAGFQLVRS